MSKIEAGKISIEDLPMSPKDVAEKVINLLKYRADEKGVNLNFSLGENIPDIVLGDPTRLNQILTNLIGNAIKFTDDGEVHLELTSSEDEIIYKVTDTGIGIPKNKLPYIFNTFEQSDKSINRRFGGTGLGLSISKKLSELMGGTIEVHSQEAVGSTFTLKLPKKLITSNKATSLPSQIRLEEMANALTGVRILIAEDNAFNQMIAQDDLNFYIKGVEIDVVENGALALEKYKSSNYQIVLMDAQMPEMDGMQATQKIREFEMVEKDGHRTPIVAMTASLLRTEIDQFLGAGMDNYIPKPYTLDELIGTIHYEVVEKN